jgi:hypothetical protein
LQTALYGLGSNPAGDPIKPSNHIIATNGPALPGQHEKDSLKGVFSEMLIAGKSLTSAKNHCTMPPDQ